MFNYILKYSPSGYTIKYLLFVIATLLPINLLLWYISNENELGRSLLNLDYLIPIILCSFFSGKRFSRTIYIGFFLLIYVIDIAKMIMVKFGFEENILNVAGGFGGLELVTVIADLYWGNIISELRQTPDIQYNVFLLSLIISVLYTGYFLLIKRRIALRFLSFISVVFVFLTLVFMPDSVFLISLETLFMLIMLSYTLYRYIRVYAGKGELLIFTIVVCIFMFTGTKSNTALDEQRVFFSNFTTFVVFNFNVEEKNIPAATEDVFAALSNGSISEYDNIILIIVESQGTLNNDEAMKSIMKIFDDKDLLKDYEVNISNLKYTGHTTTAEFRELCRWQMIGLPNITNKGEFGECLPELLKAKGFATHAIHNASKYVFDRNEWWPLLNFDQLHFLQNMQEKYKYENLCNGGDGYTAICEKDIMGKIIPDLLKENKKNFVYFLTVESHTPVDESVPVTPEYKKFCENTPVLNEKKTICRLFDIQNNLFLYTIDFAKKISDENNLIIIVGDHTPPFFKVSLNAQFNREVVPTVIIKTRKN